ncbi:MAG: 23S rRNA (uracil(1939)-C(5))-methyltransferase RlmD [Oscillospiraceae bacterium]|nr:23S rRNA (uracil(1939)-C(5))-methyltransferase RlmD [Oscillospiraceae bacterium]
MLKKNDIIQLKIDSCSLNGNGVGRHEGMAVFVPASAAGDVLLAHILKVKGNCAFGKIKEIITPSPHRIGNDCPSYPRCGGCVFRHISYEEELRVKADQVRENLRRIGHIDVEPEPIVGSDSVDHYRNKAQYPLCMERGELAIGFFAPRSHRVVDGRRCLLQPCGFEAILDAFERWIRAYSISVYDEKTCAGLLRHIYIRTAKATGETAVCAVINGAKLPFKEQLVAALLEASPQITSITFNINTEDTNVILGNKCKTIWGADHITDVLCGLRVKISPLSFYQVNPAQAERLYEKAAGYAGLTGAEKVLDLYCGAGTIGLSMAARAKTVIGAEIVPGAVADAEENARENGIANARFICADAAEAAFKLKKESVRPDVIIVDPPRKGCSPETLKAIGEMSPGRIVYVSCDSATLARDCVMLREYGYEFRKAAAFDLFPRTGHVETVALLQRRDM